MDSATIDSQAKAVRQYREKEGYLYDFEKHEYREAISAYTVPYMERTELYKMLEAAKRREFDVLVVTEIRALSRRQVEVFIIYDILQKYGVRLETIQEKFEDSAMGRLILSLRAFVAEVERENTYMRLRRGKKDRLESGSINGHNKPAYGYVFIDTDREVKARYALNMTIVYIGEDGLEWTESKVVIWIYDQILEGWSCRKIAFTLTEMGVPSPQHKRIIKGRQVSNIWHPSTVYQILTHRIYIGEVVANRFKKIENEKTRKATSTKRPEEEWVILPEGTAPPIISRVVFEAVSRQLEINKQEARRHNKAPKEEMGILRAGYAKCGICGHNLSVYRRGNTYNGRTLEPQYACTRRLGRDDILHNHFTAITMGLLDKAAWQKAVEVILDPAQVREQVVIFRQQHQPVINSDDVEATIANLQTEIDNLFELARYAKNDLTGKRLGLLMEDLEKQQREAEAILLDIDEDLEDREKLETEIIKFEKWADEVRPFLGNPDYMPTYEEQRLAVRILGLRAIVYPLHGDFPFRYKIEVSPPEIMKHLANCNQYDLCHMAL